MNERESLIELLDQVHRTHLGKEYKERLGNIAAYLLANGVVVPPCKVGDKVYQIKTNGKIAEGIVESIHQNRIL